MWKKKIQAGLIFLSVVLLTIVAGYDFAKDDFYEAVKNLDSDVTVTRSVQEESFFEMVYARLDELEQQYPDAGIHCSVNLETLLDGVVEVEIRDMTELRHYLYIGNGNIFYEFQGDMALGAWRLYLQDVLFPMAVTGDGRHISEGGFDFGAHVSGKPGASTDVYFGDLGIVLHVSGTILSAGGVQAEDASEGFCLRYVQKDDSGSERVHAVTVRAVEALPEYGTAKEIRNYFLTRCPDTVRYMVYRAVDEERDAYFYVAQEVREVHSFFSYDRQTYEVTDEIESGGNVSWADSQDGMTGSIRGQMGYASDEICLWEKNGQRLSWEDYEGWEWEFYLEQDIGNGEQFAFQIESVPEQEEDELYGGIELQVNVCRVGETEPFQTFTVNVAMIAPFFFEDFNADGYLDLAVSGSGGSNGRTLHYLWSPSRECFVEAPERLGHYELYGIDEELRRLYIHIHGSAASGSDYVYQWENEMDCVLLKYMDYSYGEGGRVKIVRGEGADEQILLDYVLDSDEDGKKERGLFWYDLVWEKEFTDQSTGRRYQIYYAQEQKKAELYESHLYVVDDTLSLFNYFEWKGASPYIEILWNAADSDKTLTICYEDGTEMVYTAAELLMGRKQDTDSGGEEN